MKYNGKEIVIDYADFPDGVHRFVRAFVTEDKDHYLIGIDSRNAPIVQRYALGHELSHLFLGHQMPSITEYLDMSKELKMMEKEANKNAWKYYRLYKDEAARN